MKNWIELVFGTIMVFSGLRTALTRSSVPFSRLWWRTSYSPDDGLVWWAYILACIFLGGGMAARASHALFGFPF